MALDLSVLFRRLARVRSSLQSFADEVEAWAFENAKIDVVEGKNLRFEVYGYAAAQPPEEFSINIGGYLHELRAILDALACMLALDNSGNEKNTYFPISASEEIFSVDGMQKIKYLSAADQSRIVALKPYSGGNPDLFSLHKLDLIHKHRRLHLMTFNLDHLLKHGGIVWSQAHARELTDKKQHLASIQLAWGLFHLRRRVAFDEPEIPAHGDGIVRFGLRALNIVSGIVSTFNQDHSLVNRSNNLA